MQSTLIRRALSVLVLSCLALPALAQTSTEEFTVIMLPDTQHYSRNYPQIFSSQTKWIAENAAKLNIRFVVGVGDVVNNGESDTQFQNADAAVRTLDNANIPYVLPVGNHDYMYSKPSSRDATKFNRYFGPSRYSGYSWYKGNYPSGSNENFYAVFNVNGKQYLVLALEFYPRQKALDWASSILVANADKEVIVLTHSYVNDDNTRVGRCDYANAESMGVGNDNDGDEMWSRFIRKNKNIRMVLSGHIHGVGRRTERGENGNIVNQILADYQGEHMGGNGYLRILRYKPALNQIEVKTYSPYANAYRTDSANQFTLPMYATAENAGTGIVDGFVRGADCRELPGANVVTSSGQATTDASGKYVVAAPAPAAQSVAAGKSGWVSKTLSLAVSTNLSTLADFYLEPALPCTLSSTDKSVTVCTPTSTATSPVKVAAGGRSLAGVSSMTLYVDGKKLYSTSGDKLIGSFAMSSGTRSLTVKGWDKAGNSFSKSLTITVTSGSSYCTLSSSSVTVCTPQESATYKGLVRVTAAGPTGRTISSMSVYLNGVKVYEVSANRVDTWLGMGARPQRLTVKATDSSGNSYSKTVSFSVALP